MNDLSAITTSFTSALFKTIVEIAYNLTINQLVMLLKIKSTSEEVLSLSDYARSIGVSAAAITSMANRLEQYGMVVRERNIDSNSKKIGLSLTQEGTDLCNRFQENLREELQKHFV